MTDDFIKHKDRIFKFEFNDYGSSPAAICTMLQRWIHGNWRQMYSRKIHIIIEIGDDNNAK